MNEEEAKKSVGHLSAKFSDLIKEIGYPQDVVLRFLLVEILTMAAQNKAPLEEFKEITAYLNQAYLDYLMEGKS